MFALFVGKPKYLAAVLSLGILSGGLSSSGSVPQSTAVSPSSAQSHIHKVLLYRILFTHLAHLERDRQRIDPNRHVDLVEVEANLQKRIGLSKAEWQALLDTGVRVNNYTEEMSDQAKEIAATDRATRGSGALGSNANTGGRERLHDLQLELNGKVLRDVRTLQETIGPEASLHIEAYLDGTLSQAVHRTTISPENIRARQLSKEPKQ